MQGRVDEAQRVLTRIVGDQQAAIEIQLVTESLALEEGKPTVRPQVSDLFKKPMRLVLTIGLTVAVLQQITGINSVFFYAPMIFEQSGIGTDAAFMQAILVGLTNLVFTLIAMALIDKVGRKPLLVFGVAGITFFMMLLAWGFNEARYVLSEDAIAGLSAAIDRSRLFQIQDLVFSSDVQFIHAITGQLGQAAARTHESEIIAAAITIQPMLILFGILGFVACFAISIGPVMWVLFSELFPNRIRGLAISFVGLVNSGVSFIVQLLFPWQLANLGNAGTFFLYGLFAAIGLLLIVRLLPETRGKSLEELEKELVLA
jgi:MFS family permease